MTVPADGAPPLEVRGVSKWFGSLVAVSDVSFDVGPGVTALLGPNGAGKSTMLRMLCGLARPSKGTVRILGHDPRSHVAVTRQVGLVPQQETVFEPLTAFAFVRLAAILHDRPRSRRRCARRARDRRARPVRRAAPSHVLEGNAPEGEARAGDRARPAGDRSRRAADGARPAPARAHDRAVPPARRRGPVRRRREPRARRGRALRLGRPRDGEGQARRVRRLPRDPGPDGRPPAADPRAGERAEGARRRPPPRRRRRGRARRRRRRPRSSTPTMRGGSPGRSRRWPGRAAPACSRCGPSTRISKTCSATWWSDERHARRRRGCRRLRAALELRWRCTGCCCGCW